MFVGAFICCPKIVNDIYGNDIIVTLKTNNKRR